MDLFARCNGYRARFLVWAALMVTIAGCEVASQPYEYIHLPSTEPAAGGLDPFPWTV